MNFGLEAAKAASFEWYYIVLPRGLDAHMMVVAVADAIRFQWKRLSVGLARTGGVTGTKGDVLGQATEYGV